MSRADTEDKNIKYKTLLFYESRILLNDEQGGIRSLMMNWSTKLLFSASIGKQMVYMKLRGFLLNYVMIKKVIHQNTQNNLLKNSS